MDSARIEGSSSLFWIQRILKFVNQKHVALHLIQKVTAIASASVWLLLLSIGFFFFFWLSVGDAKHSILIIVNCTINSWSFEDSILQSDSWKSFRTVLESFILLLLCSSEYLLIWLVISQGIVMAKAPLINVAISSNNPLLFASQYRISCFWTRIPMIYLSICLQCNHKHHHKH